MIQIDINAVVGVVIGGALLSVFGGLIGLVFQVKKLVYIIGTSHPPDGLLGKVLSLENELNKIRDWAMGNGFDRRTHNNKLD